jgi:hypothetical protein
VFRRNLGVWRPNKTQRIFGKPAGFEIVNRTHPVEIQRERFEPNAFKMQPLCAKIQRILAKNRCIFALYEFIHNKIKALYVYSAMEVT